MRFPITINYQISKLPSWSQLVQNEIKIYSGFTVLVGPNASGKTQILKSLRQPSRKFIGSRKVRFLSAGRLSSFENFHSNYDGRRNEDYYDDNARLGDKDYQKSRHSNETVIGDFHTIKARPDIEIKVAERLKQLFKRELFLEWDAGYLKLNFTRVDKLNLNYSSSREASGLLHLIALLAALYDDEVGALLIDEPEVSLHPQLQAFFLQEVRQVSGDPDIKTKKLVLIATHSTEMLEVRQPEDLCNIIRGQAGAGGATL